MIVMCLAVLGGRRHAWLLAHARNTTNQRVFARLCAAMRAAEQRRPTFAPEGCTTILEFLTYFYIEGVRAGFELRDDAVPCHQVVWILIMPALHTHRAVLR